MFSNPKVFWCTLMMHHSHFQIATPLARQYLDKLTKSQSGRKNPVKEFRNDPLMRLYKHFDQVQHSSVSTAVLSTTVNSRLLFLEGLRGCAKIIVSKLCPRWA